MCILLLLFSCKACQQQDSSIVYLGISWHVTVSREAAALPVGVTESSEQLHTNRQYSWSHPIMTMLPLDYTCIHTYVYAFEKGTLCDTSFLPAPGFLGWGRVLA